VLNPRHIADNPQLNKLSKSFAVYNRKTN